jgi:hypothetical protein
MAAKTDRDKRVKAVISPTGRREIVFAAWGASQPNIRNAS